MGKKLKSLDEIGPLLEEFANDILNNAIFETDARVKEASPIDTNRLRGSWMIGENSEAGEPLPPGDYGTEIPPPVAINFTLGEAQIGNVYSIHNNLEYAEPVAYGTNLPPSWGGQYKTRQNVKPGFPDEVAKEMQAFVDQAAQQARRIF